MASEETRPRGDSFQNLPDARKFFSNKEAVENILKNLQNDVTSKEDGDLISAWILTMIDHWNNDHEKIVILLQNTLYIIKYDFVTKRVKDVKKVTVSSITDSKIGNLVYPPKSLMPPRNDKGVQLIWGDMAGLSFAQKWNPMSRTIPYAVFTNHPLYKTLSDSEQKEFYSAEHFGETIRKILESNNKVVRGEDILIESYGNVSSIVFNQSSLGFSKDRNGISF